MKGFPDIPPIWWAGTIVIIYLGKWMAPALHVEAAVLSFASRLLLILALGLVAWSGWWFFVKKTPIEPHHTPKTLIVEGPYRLTRNPIYLALVALTVSSALGHGSALGLLAAGGLWWVLDRRFAAPEEVLLHTIFGAEAENYLQNTKRWL
jgi:protein-S-isoprenylcysteine O-methyltransferase Ste14